MTTAPLDDLAALLAPLHAPFTCKSLKAPNRFCMAPMSRCSPGRRIVTGSGSLARMYGSSSSRALPGYGCTPVSMR